MTPQDTHERGRPIREAKTHETMAVVGEWHPKLCVGDLTAKSARYRAVRKAIQHRGKVSA